MKTMYIGVRQFELSSRNHIICIRQWKTSRDVCGVKMISGGCRITDSIQRLEFEPGDMVWLNASNISTSRPSKKLNWKCLGPYKVIKRIGLQAYQLALPPTMHHLHDVFHISLLDPVKATSLPPHMPPPPPALYIKDNQEYFEIEDILDSKCMGRRLQYLIKWKGFPDSENSSKPRANIPARGLIKEFPPPQSWETGRASSSRLCCCIVGLISWIDYNPNLQVTEWRYNRPVQADVNPIGRVYL